MSGSSTVAGQADARRRLRDELRELGYTLGYNARGWSVWIDGKKIGGGGREEFGGETPFDTSNWIGKHRQCALWVAERHLARQNAGHGAGGGVGQDVQGGGEE